LSLSDKIRVKNLTILGSTGSIGKSTLGVVRKFPDQFKIRALAAHTSIDALAKQVVEFLPELVVVRDKDLAGKLKTALQGATTPHPYIMYGDEGYQKAATLDSVDMVVSSMVGAAGLLPTLAAIRARKQVALANKETLVMAGALVMREARENGVKLMPIDSEHSAIFQCLQGNDRKDLDKILLTASGGPFRTVSREKFESLAPEDALSHPTWDMGAKITIDSSTLMNKGLEVIEAKWLFDVRQQDIQVVVHPQSIIHSMVAYKDGSVIAQLGVPDMAGAIAYAMSYPDRLPLGQPIPDFFALGSLDFFEPDLEKFPCLALAQQACRDEQTYPAVLNAANEIAVQAFLDHQIRFPQIPQLIEKCLNAHTPSARPDLEQILEADAWARDYMKQAARS
jgi:1-deoxy-D-xylulose-5-phosphate reductoisomerase